LACGSAALTPLPLDGSPRPWHTTGCSTKPASPAQKASRGSAGCRARRSPQNPPRAGHSTPRTSRPGCSCAPGCSPPPATLPERGHSCPLHRAQASDHPQPPGAQECPRSRLPPQHAVLPPPSKLTPSSVSRLVVLVSHVPHTPLLTQDHDAPDTPLLMTMVAVVVTSFVTRTAPLVLA
jgi:hypothetical protein